mmetsp:Transcript_12113/g.33319  ORF Transcript_12113/g.33319 Transcript_12113/m.33319 type:complete len:232 (-) Transcript_12113:21-716(-)
MTVLSTRVRDLLPRVHDVWANVVPSFAAGAPLAVQADACVLLKHMARLSGDFVRQRFGTDCWPGLWTQLRDLTPVVSAEAAAWSPKLKAQFAALDALAFLAGDPVVVGGVTEELVVVGLKFCAANVAERVCERSWALLVALARSDPDLLWLYVQGMRHEGKVLLPQETGGSSPSTVVPLKVDLPLLSQAGVGAMEYDRYEKLGRLLEHEDLVLLPRVALSWSGQLWCATDS